MRLPSSSGVSVGLNPAEAAAFPDGAELRRWTRRRTRRHRRGVWALVGDIYSGLLTIGVVGTILVPHLSRLVAARPSSSTQESAELGVLDLDPGWLVLTLTMLLLALGIGPLSWLGPLFLRPHEAAWWLPMPGDRGTLLLSVACVEYLIAATTGAAMGVLPALASAGGWGSAVAWPALIAAGTCLALSELITAQVRGRGVTRLRRILILVGAAACLAGRTLSLPRSMTGNVVVAVLAGVLVAAGTLRWRQARLVLGHVRDDALLVVVARSFGAHVSLLSLDTRAVGRLLSPALPRPAAPSPLRLARIGRRLPRSVRVLMGVAQADWILLRRQLQRLLQIGGRSGRCGTASPVGVCRPPDALPGLPRRGLDRDPGPRRACPSGMVRRGLLTPHGRYRPGWCGWPAGWSGARP